MNREKAAALLKSAVAIADRLCDGYEVFWHEATLPMWHLLVLTFGFLFFSLSNEAGPSALWIGIASIAFSLASAWIKGGAK